MTQAMAGKPILIQLFQEARPLTICRSITSLWLNWWDEKQRKKVKFDTGKKLKSPFGQFLCHKGFLINVME